MYRVGVDIIEIARVRRVIDRWGQRFLSRVYTEAELEFCRGRVPELAVRFAAKEAVMKALGTGIRGISWRDIEILPNRRNAPLVYLHGGARRRARRLGITELAISLSHSRENAIASVIAAAQGAF
ncbi:MAG TPA: holo-[acyl-carrier-protein] synthase [Dehalococcoidia bacterium]|nr:holo-[acyl-carrier-protein] synthase [Dehalococcoidia bacterium]